MTPQVQAQDQVMMEQTFPLLATIAIFAVSGLVVRLVQAFGGARAPATRRPFRRDH